MNILALEKEYEGISSVEFQKYAEAEAARVWQLYKSDKIREMYFRGDQKNAVIILECDSLQEAEDTLSSLPYVKNKMTQFETFLLKPYPGFGRLFSKDKS